MNNITAETSTDGGRKVNIRYVTIGETTPSGIMGGAQEERFVLSHIPTTGMESGEEFVGTDALLPLTVVSVTKRIVEILKSVVSLLDEVLEVYDDEIERINTFSLVEEKIKSLWKLREGANENFVDVLILLEVAVRNSHYQNYQKNQYQSIKMVLEKIKGVHITPQQVKEYRKLLMDNGIDLFAPIRDWENYTVEIKKNDATE